MLRTIPVVLGVVAMIACGVVHGFWTDRWVPAKEPKEAAALSVKGERTSLEKQIRSPAIAQTLAMIATRKDKNPWITSSAPFRSARSKPL